MFNWNEVLSVKICYLVGWFSSPSGVDIAWLCINFRRCCYMPAFMWYLVLRKVMYSFCSGSLHMPYDFVVNISMPAFLRYSLWLNIEGSLWSFFDTVPCLWEDSKICLCWSVCFHPDLMCIVLRLPSRNRKCLILWWWWRTRVILKGLGGILFISLSWNPFSFASSFFWQIFLLLSCANGDMMCLSRRPNLLGFGLLLSVTIFNARWMKFVSVGVFPWDRWV